MHTMKHLINLTLCLLLGVFILSCSERTICPAYQSAFIHDKNTLDKHFSYFGEDTLPKPMFTASKNKFLIIDRVSYRTKLRSLNSVNMETIYPVLDDSTALQGDAIMLAEMDVVDSVALDSAAVSELPWKEKFNVEQEFYFHYFNDILVYPEERALAKQEEDAKKGTSASTSEGEKQNFFKRIFSKLFKKGDKGTTDEESSDIDLEEGDIDETEQADGPPKKKGLFGKKKNKNKPSQEEEIAEEPDPIEEEEDDGEDDF